MTGGWRKTATPVEIYTAPADPLIVRMFGPANEFGGVVRDGVLATSLGPVPAAGIGNGQRALCIVRADGVEVAAAPPGGSSGHVRVRVEAARVLGPTSYLLLEPTSGRTPGRLAADDRSAAARPPRTGSRQRGLGAREKGADLRLCPRLTPTGYEIGRCPESLRRRWLQHVRRRGAAHGRLSSRACPARAPESRAREAAGARPGWARR